MPNTGRPSRDCHLCRERRIKCDLTRPACRRCMIAGRVCPGYRDDLDLLFHQSESVSSYPTSSARDRRYRNRLEQNVIRQSAQDPAQFPTNTPSTEQTPSHQVAARATRLPVLPRGLTEPWDEHVIPLIVNQLSPSSGPRRLLGVVDFFPEALESSEPNEVLMLSSKAVLFAYLSNKYDDAQLQNKKIVTYGRAITAVNTALGDPNHCTQDNVVFSIFLLGMYELLNGSHATHHQPGPADWVKHTQGLIGVFRLRGREQFTNQRGCDIFRLLNDNIQTLVLTAGQPCPEETFEWMHIIEPYVLPADLDAHQRAVQTHHAAAICARIKQTLKTQSPLPLGPVFNDIDEVDTKLATIVTRKSFAETMRVGMGHNRNYGNTVRLKAQYYIVELIRTQDVQDNEALIDSEDLRQRESKSISLIQELADEILCTTPYLLGPDPGQQSSSTTDELPDEVPRPWVESIRLLWPLRTIAGGTCVRQDQIKSATDALKRISSEYQVRFALEPIWISDEQLRRRQSYDLRQRPAHVSSSGTQNQ